MQFKGDSRIARRMRAGWDLAVLLGVLALACALLAGCTLGGDDDRRLAFASSVRLDEQAQTEITIVARNVGDRLFARDERLDGRGEVFNEGQQLLARFTQDTLEKLTAGEETTLVTWQGVLEPGTYVMRWTTARYGGVELEFTLLKRFGVLEVGTVKERQLPPDPPADTPS